jgi:hypothetical protein
MNTPVAVQRHRNNTEKVAAPFQRKARIREHLSACSAVICASTAGGWSFFRVYLQSFRAAPADQGARTQAWLEATSRPRRGNIAATPGRSRPGFCLFEQA